MLVTIGLASCTKENVEPINTQPQIIYLTDTVFVPVEPPTNQIYFIQVECFSGCGNFGPRILVNGTSFTTSQITAFSGDHISVYLGGNWGYGDGNSSARIWINNEIILDYSGPAGTIYEITLE
jgi:hypothetical protein